MGSRLPLITGLCIASVVALAPSRARALTGEQDGWRATAAFDEPSYEAFVDAIFVPERAYGLTSERLIGRYGLSAQEALRILAPHLDGLTVVPVRVTEAGNGDTVHEVYELRLGAYRVARAGLSLHHHRNRLVFLRAELPEFRLPESEEYPTPQDWLPVDELGFASPFGYAQRVEAVIVESAGAPQPAWEIVRVSELGGATEILLVDASTGALLERQELDFQLATVYEKGPADGILLDVTLPNLLGTGYLDGQDVAVFAPDEKSPRVHSREGLYQFNPADPARAVEFDQVQAYYSATKALDWFRRRFDYDSLGVQIRVQVNDLIHGRADNAQYTPPPIGPLIQIGKGSSLRNLARDSDVLIHEFSHHVIFQSLRATHGQTGELHEAMADYFTYALNGDPYLGESIVPGEPYLRTALIDDHEGRKIRYDDARNPEEKYFRAQIWAALLWELRSRIGESFDDVVYGSLAYLGRMSGYRDAIFGLLSADRDHHPRPEGDPDAGAFGAHKCDILRAVVARGYATFVEDLNGASCSLDLASLAEESRKFRDESAGLPTGTGKKASISAFGKTCAAVGAGHGGVLSLILLLPPLGVWLFSIGVRRHGS